MQNIQETQSLGVVPPGQGDQQQQDSAARDPQQECQQDSQQRLHDGQRQPQQPPQHGEPIPSQEPVQQRLNDASARIRRGMPPQQLQLPAVPGYTQPNYEGLMMLEASLRSPDSFMPRSFITADATTPAPKKARKVPDDAPGDAAGQQQPSSSAPQDRLEEGVQPSSSAGLATGTMAAMLAAEAGRSAAFERYSSMSLLSPSGGFLMGPLKTPRLARLSTILSADMEPQMPQEPAPTDAPAGNNGLAGLFSPNMAHAGTKRTHSEAKFDDECTEICEAAQAAAMSSPTQGGSLSLAALRQWQQTIEAAELQWGSSHPAVGRAWLELARALQAADKDSDRAKHATKKAFDICQILLKQTGTESHAQESFEYLLAKFNTKAAKQAAAAADKAKGATLVAEAFKASPAAAAAAAGPAALAGSLLGPVSLPLDPQQLPSSVTPAPSTSAAAATVDQVQPPFMSPYFVYPPVSQHRQLSGYPGMPHLTLQALCGLPGLQAAGSPVVASAAQLLAADMQAAALMSCGYPAAVLMQHSMMMHAGPAGEALSLMQPSLFASPARQQAAAGTATKPLGGAPAGTGPAPPTAAAADSQQDKASGASTDAVVGGSSAAAAIALLTAGAGKGKETHEPADANDKTAAAPDQQPGEQPKAKVVLSL